MNKASNNQYEPVYIHQLMFKSFLALTEIEKYKNRFTQNGKFFIVVGHFDRFNGFRGKFIEIFHAFNISVKYMFSYIGHYKNPTYIGAI